jgi:hypothetical protein
MSAVSSSALILRTHITINWVNYLCAQTKLQADRDAKIQQQISDLSPKSELIRLQKTQETFRQEYGLPVYVFVREWSLHDLLHTSMGLQKFFYGSAEVLRMTRTP